MLSAARQRNGPPDRIGMVGVFSPGILRIPHLASFLGAERIVFAPTRWQSVDAVVGWGRKANTARARRHAAQVGCAYLHLEDGFVRSLDLGIKGDTPCSIVVDDIGVYYDATAPSRLEAWLEGEGPDDPLADPALIERAARCIERIRRDRLSKYNAAPIFDLGPKERPRVLVVDQTAGDLSLRYGACHPDGFVAMIESARAENPGAEIFVKTHPDVATGKKRGGLSDVALPPGVRVLTEPANPIALLEQVDRVYVMSSLLGFEALMAKKPVTCFGTPFYAGWGLTDDRMPCARRTRRRSLEEVFAGAYLLYARYVDLETGARSTLEATCDELVFQRRMMEATTGTFVCVGFSAWKRGFVPDFLETPRSTVRFARSVEAAEQRGLPDDATLVVWASGDTESARRLGERAGIPVWRMEDGFLRSVGLGSDLFAPASLVLDDRGIYYDPTRPSALEQILQETDFTAEERERARALRESILRAGLTKYNVGADRTLELPSRTHAPVVLVVGQVEDDASIRLGCPGIRTNLALLEEVREQRPDAVVVFRPHPDVVSGNRRGAVPPEVARALADVVADDHALAACLERADEVHTLSSLVGFEALLREKRVFTYGQPFYSGWGLTQDRHPHPRRTRRLSLDELVAGTLIRYPRYISLRTGRLTTPEVIVRQLTELRDAHLSSSGVRVAWSIRQARKARNLVRGVLRGVLHAS